MSSTRNRGASAGEYDVFVCCPDPGHGEPCATLIEYLKRAGFRVYWEAADGGRSRAERLALVESTSDFLLFLPASGHEAPPERGAGEADNSGSSQWPAEVSAALATGRNVVRVSMAGEAAAPLPAALGLGDLDGKQATIYDPDRLAESLAVIQHCLSTDTIVNDRDMMRRTKRWFVLAGLLLLAGVSVQTVPLLIRAWNAPRPLPPVAPFSLYWTAFAERDVAGTAEEIPIGNGARVAAGDRLRVLFSTSADGFAYVVGKDTRGRVWVLFPGDSLKKASRVRAGRTYQAPVDGGWLTVDPQVGLDTLYVFAGYDPLQNLEELLEEPEIGNDTGARRSLVDQTVAGLLDGRHYPPGQRIWIRSTALVDQGLVPAPGPATFSTALASGRSTTHASATQPGLVNALAEIKLTFVRQ